MSGSLSEYRKALRHCADQQLETLIDDDEDARSALPKRFHLPTAPKFDWAEEPKVLASCLERILSPALQLATEESLQWKVLEGKKRKELAAQTVKLQEENAASELELYKIVNDMAVNCLRQRVTDAPLPLSTAHTSEVQARDMVALAACTPTFHQPKSEELTAMAGLEELVCGGCMAGSLDAFVEYMAAAPELFLGAYLGDTVNFLACWNSA